MVSTTEPPTPNTTSSSVENELRTQRAIRDDHTPLAAGRQVRSASVSESLPVGVADDDLSATARSADHLALNGLAANRYDRRRSGREAAGVAPRNRSRRPRQVRLPPVPRLRSPRRNPAAHEQRSRVTAPARERHP